MAFALRFGRACTRFVRVCMMLSAIVLLSGCAETNFVSHYAKKMPWPGHEESAGSYKVGKPYRVGNVWHYPKETFSMTETGIASWYGPDFHGKRTANGEIYDKNELTAAHRTLQMPSLVRVTNLENGRAVVVRINDRGPFKKGRIIDVSERAAELLAFKNRGTARVRVQVLEQESRQIAAAAKRGMDTSRITLADLERMEPASAPARPVLIAARESTTDALPESLQTPMITVEELSAESPRGQDRGPRYDAPQPRQERKELVSGHMHSGRFMPAPVVTQEPVLQTGIFVQAGSFSVQENALNMKKKFGHLAPVQIDPVVVKGRQFYRVRLGPVASVSEADRLLDQVIRAGNDTARVIRQ